MFKPTEQQVHAITTAHKGETFVVDACAGSGKTTTARQMCQAIEGDVLYLVYNKAAANDARKSFPANTKVSTTSAIAWHHYPEYQERMLNSRIPSRETARLARIEPLPLGGNTLPLRPSTVAMMATDAIQKFCYSADTRISAKHVFVDTPGLDAAQYETLREGVAHWALKIWKDSIKQGSKHRFTFDHAFKLLTMSAPDLGYDTVIIDEAQDSNWCTLALLKAQVNSQLVCIGDPAQQLYAWRGASDIMGEFHGPRLALSKSFRFGQRIADEAHKWLIHTGTGIEITGNEAMDSKVTDGQMERPDAILCRFNATVMSRSMAMIADNKKVAIVGGTKALKDLAKAAGKLRAGEPCDHPELAAFRDWGELMSYSQEPGGGDLKALINMVNQYGTLEILKACDAVVPENEEEARRQHKTFVKPDVVVSTAHKAKGREWPNVEVADDFNEPKEDTDPATGKEILGEISKHEAMLHYVTVTRGRQHVNRGGLGWADKYEKQGRAKVLKEKMVKVG